MTLAGKFSRDKDNFSNWTCYAMLPQAEFTLEKFNEYDVLTEVRHHPDGILLNDKQQRIDAFNVLPVGRKVGVVKEKYILERTPLGFVLSYNPVRAKRLVTCRKRNKYVGRCMPRRTCFDLLIKLLIKSRDTVECDAIHNLYHEGWSGRGIRCFSRAIENFIQLAKLMHRYRRFVRVCTPILRELWIHQPALRKRADKNFVAWYETIMKKIGAPSNVGQYKVMVKSESGGRR
jgi:hypothetical protein